MPVGRMVVLGKRGEGMQHELKAVLFDFGGVIAEEGFWEGIQTIGKEHGLDPDAFFRMIDALIYETGYLTGKADEAEFWNEVRKNTGISCTDTELRTRDPETVRSQAGYDRLGGPSEVNGAHYCNAERPDELA